VPRSSRALKRVRQVEGSPGVDGMTVDELPEHLAEHREEIREQLVGGTHQPRPVKRQEVPESGGGVRELGIPTALDRFVQHGPPPDAGGVRGGGRHLVDYVSAEALLAGGFAGEWVRGVRRPEDNVRIVPGQNVASCVPQTLASGREHAVYLRWREPMRPCHLQVGDPLEKKLPFVVPAETIVLERKPDLLDRFHGDALRIDIRPAEEVRP